MNIPLGMFGMTPEVHSRRFKTLRFCTQEFQKAEALSHACAVCNAQKSYVDLLILCNWKMVRSRKTEQFDTIGGTMFALTKRGHVYLRLFGQAEKGGFDGASGK